MRPNFTFTTLAFIFCFNAMPWGQPLKPLSFSRKTLYHDLGMKDSIKIHNPNRTAIMLDSVEVWNENRAEGSMVSLDFQSDVFNGRVRLYLGSARKEIKQGVFVWSRTDSLKNNPIALKANGDTWLSGFQIDRCPVCKQSAAGAIMDTLQFKFILHHALGADSIQVFTDNRIALSIKPMIRSSKTLTGVAGKSFDFLGRQNQFPSVRSVSKIEF
jgi:hypothetical protein